MKKLETKLKQLQSAHTMSMSEKAQMHDSLKEYMALKPMRTKKSFTSLLSRPHFSFSLLWQHKLTSAALIIVLFVTSGAGAAYASTDALPGERLYSVKEIVEDVHERILISNIAKAEFAERLTKRREDEAQRLEVLDKLDAPRAAIIERRISRHTARAERVLVQIEQDSPQKAQRIRTKLNQRVAHIQNIRAVQQKKHAQRFAQLMNVIDAEYEEGAQALQELEVAVQEMETLIHNQD